MIAGQEGKMYKLKKALYGLNVKLNKILVGLNFH